MKGFFQNNKRLLSKMVIFAMLLSLCSGAAAPAQVRAEAEAITIISQPEDVTVTAGNITETLTVAATTTATGGALTFQWYSCDDTNKTNAAEEEGATEATFAIPADLEAGEYYYYCEVGAEDVDAVQTDVAKVTVENAVASVAETGDGSCNHEEGLVFNDLDTSETVTISEDATYYLTGDYEFAKKAIVISSDCTVVICTNGYNISNSESYNDPYLFKVFTGAKLIIKNCSEEKESEITASFVGGDAHTNTILCGGILEVYNVTLKNVTGGTRPRVIGIDGQNAGEIYLYDSTITSPLVGISNINEDLKYGTVTAEDCIFEKTALTNSGWWFGFRSLDKVVLKDCTVMGDIIADNVQCLVFEGCELNCNDFEETTYAAIGIENYNCKEESVIKNCTLTAPNSVAISYVTNGSVDGLLLLEDSTITAKEGIELFDSGYNVAKLYCTIKGDTSLTVEEAHMSFQGDVVLDMEEAELQQSEMKVALRYESDLPQTVDSPVLLALCPSDYASYFTAYNAGFYVYSEPNEEMYNVYLGKPGFAQQPTSENPKVEVNLTKNVSYQWYSAEETETFINDTNTINEDAGIYNYAGNNKWGGFELGGDYVYFGAVGSFKAGDKLVIEWDKEDAVSGQFKIAIDDYEYFPISEEKSSFTYVVSSMTERLTVMFVLGEGYDAPPTVTAKIISYEIADPVEGQNSNTLKQGSKGKTYACVATWNEGSELEFSATSDFVTLAEDIENTPAPTTTLTYEVIGGTGSMASATLTVGEKFVLPDPSFMPDANCKFYGWFVFDSVGDGEVVVFGYEKPEFTPSGEHTYTAIACYGYPVDVKDLPEGTDISYTSKMLGNPNALVIPIPEDEERIPEVVNQVTITNTSMTSAPTLTPENATAEYDEENSSEGSYKYLIENITGPVTLTVVPAQEEPAPDDTTHEGHVEHVDHNGWQSLNEIVNSNRDNKNGITLSAGNYYLDGDLELVYSSYVENNSQKFKFDLLKITNGTVVICMDGYSIYVDGDYGDKTHMFEVSAGATLIIENCSKEINSETEKCAIIMQNRTYTVVNNIYSLAQVFNIVNKGTVKVHNVDLINNNEGLSATIAMDSNSSIAELYDCSIIGPTYNHGVTSKSLFEGGTIQGKVIASKCKFCVSEEYTYPACGFNNLEEVILTDCDVYADSITKNVRRVVFEKCKLYASEKGKDVALHLVNNTSGTSSLTNCTLEAPNLTAIECTAGSGNDSTLELKNCEIKAKDGLKLNNVNCIMMGDISLDIEGVHLYLGDTTINLDMEEAEIVPEVWKLDLINGVPESLEPEDPVALCPTDYSERFTLCRVGGYIYSKLEGQDYGLYCGRLGITEQPTKDNPTVEVNDIENASYQWYTVGPKEISIDNNYTNGAWGIYNEDAEMWEGEFNERGDEQFYSCIEATGPFQAGDKLILVMSEPVFGTFAFFDYDSYRNEAFGPENGAISAITYEFTEAREYFVVRFFPGDGQNAAPKMKVSVICNEIGDPIEGQNTDTLTLENPEEMYTCIVTWHKDSELEFSATSDFINMAKDTGNVTPDTPTPKEYNVSKIKVGDILYKGDTIIGDISNAYVWFCRYEYEQGVSVLDEYVIRNELGDDVADEVWAKGWEVFDVVAEDEEGRYSILLRAEDESGIYTKLVAPEVSVEKNTEGAYELSIQEESGYTYYYKYMPLGADRGDGNPLTYEDALEMAEWMLAEEFTKTKSLYNEKDKAPYGDVYEEAVTFGETGGVIMVLKYLDTEGRWIEAGMNVFVAGEASEGGGSGFISSFDVQFDWNKVPQLEVGMDESTVPYFESAPATAKGTGIVEDIYYGWAIKVDESFKLTQEEADELGIDSSSMANYNSDIDDYITNWGSWAMLDLLLDYGYKVNEDDIYSVFVTVNAKNGYNFGEEGKVYTGTINSNVEVGTCISADFYAVSFFKLGTIADIEQEKENAGGSTPTPDTPTPKEYNVSDIKVGDRLFAGDTINGDISNAYVWFCRYEYEQGVAVLDEYVIQNELGDDVADEVWAKGWEVFDVVAEDEEGRYSILLRAEDETGIYTKLVEPEVSVQKNEAGVYELSIQEEIGYTYYYMFAPLGTDLGEGYIMTYEAALEEAERILEDKLPKYKSLYNEMEGAPNGDIYGAKVSFGETGALVMVLKYLDDEERWIETGMTALVAGEATPVHEHVWSEKWSKDTNYHWHECEGTVGTCDITANADKNGYGRHAYSNSYDSSCNTCGYERSVYIPPYVPETTPEPTPVPTAVPTPVPTATPIPGVVTVPTMDETVVDKSGKEVTSLVQDAGTTNKLEIAGITDQPGAVVTYTSTNTNAVEVDAAGNVTMKNPGMSEITITVGEGENAKQETIVVVVEEPPMYVNDEEEAIKNIRLGTSANDIPLVRYQEPGQTIDINFWGVKNWMKDKYEYVWNTSDSSVAVTDSLGKVTALKPGVVTMTLGLKNKQTGKMLNVKSIEVVIPEDSGEKILLGTSQNSIFDSLTLRPEDRVDINFYGVKNWKKEDYEYRWISSEPTTVWVDKVGKVTPVKPGSATITLVLIDKKTGFPKYVVPTTVTILDKDVK